jgi:lipoprotein NlpI
MVMRWLFLLLLGSILFPPAARAETVDSLLKKARQALAKNRTKEALDLAGRAIDQDEKSVPAYVLRGQIYGLLGGHKEAVADFGKAITLDPNAAEAYNRRGMERFKLGQFKEAIADFDHYLKLKPGEEPGHWQRGIAYYYAGRFEEGARQFEGYQSVDRNDVENAVWRYLCMTRTVGVEKARASLLKIGEDRRVPMMTVYALFAGKAKPAEVLEAAQAGKPTADELRERLFYAHLYLGLYYEAAGEAKLAREHVARAAEDYKLPGHYMWDVARVHYDVLKKKSKSGERRGS